MKKIFLILLICAYALSTMGVGLKEFYCCGKLKSKFITLTGNNKADCTTEGCCKTKHQFLKLKDNHLASADIYLPVKHFVTLSFGTSACLIAASFAQQTVHTNGSHAPPLYDKELPLYLSNRVFRI
jgi:hypothetical protein